MFRAFAVLGLVVATLFLFKDGVVLEDVGLLGSCDSVVTPAGLGFSAEWRVCYSGKIDGQPDLSSRGCFRQGAAQKVAYWLCPVDVERAGARSVP